MSDVKLASTKKPDEVLLACIDTAFKVFGETVRRMVLHYLETMHSVKREEIPRRLEDFQKGFEELLGGTALMVEGSIVNNLYSELGLEQTKGLSFVEAVKAVYESMGRSK